MKSQQQIENALDAFEKLLEAGVTEKWKMNEQIHILKWVLDREVKK